MAAAAAGIGLIWWGIDLYRLAEEKVEFPAPLTTP
jgi:hypothetical protein